MTRRVGGGGLEAFLTAEYTSSQNEISKAMADYQFKPKKQTELIIWIIQPSDIAAGSGSVTPFAYVLWRVGGVFTSNNGSGWMAGSALSKPWDTTPSFSARSASNFSIDADGYLSITTGTWGYIGSGQTIRLYEIPLDPTEI